MLLSYLDIRMPQCTGDLFNGNAREQKAYAEAIPEAVGISAFNFC
jgi:hypothetical protein